MMFKNAAVLFLSVSSLVSFLVPLLKKTFLLSFVILVFSGCSGKPESPGNTELTANPSESKASSSLLKIRSGLMKELPPGQSIGAIYLQIENASDKTATLTYVHSDAAEKIEVHRHIYNDGMMQMRNVPHLSIDPKTTLDFKPGEHHLMAFGMTEPPKAGESFDVVFEFAGFPSQTLNIVVEKP